MANRIQSTGVSCIGSKGRARISQIYHYTGGEEGRNGSECHKPDREGGQMVAKPEGRNRLEAVLGMLEQGMEVELRLAQAIVGKFENIRRGVEVFSMVCFSTRNHIKLPRSANLSASESLDPVLN